MKIYIDEAGNFIPNTGGTKYSCGVALVVPDSQEANLFRWAATLIARWDAENGGKELKGSSLSEIQARTLIELVHPYDPLLVVCLIDAGTHAEAEILKLIATQANNVTKNLTPEHHPKLVGELQTLKGSWEALPPQLAIQAFIFFALVETVIRDSTLYYVQRLPAELGACTWVLDAKDPTKVTNYERVWSDLLKPFLQATFISDPLDLLDGADYSSFQAFNFAGEIPETVKATLSEVEQRGPFTDARKLMADMRFEPSALTGLRLVDMLAATVRRAFAGNLRVDGWRYAGRLMVCKSPMVRILALSATPQASATLSDTSVLGVLETLGQHCKGMIVK